MINKQYLQEVYVLGPQAITFSFKNIKFRVPTINPRGVNIALHVFPPKKGTITAKPTVTIVDQRKNNIKTVIKPFKTCFLSMSYPTYIWAKYTQKREKAKTLNILSIVKKLDIFLWTSLLKTYLYITYIHLSYIEKRQKCQESKTFRYFLYKK